MAGFKNTYTTHDPQVVCLSQPPRGSFVNDGEVGFEQTREKDCSQFAGTLWMTRAKLEDFSSGRRGMDFDPTRATNSLGCWSAGATHDHLLAHLVRDMNF
jgi:hypothetical protein